MADADLSDLILVIIAIFIPPGECAVYVPQSAASDQSLPVNVVCTVTALFTDGCGGQFCLNILLTILGFFPGLIHAVSPRPTFKPSLLPKASRAVAY